MMVFVLGSSRHYDERDNWCQTNGKYMGPGEQKVCSSTTTSNVEVIFDSNDIKVYRSDWSRMYEYFETRDISQQVDDLTVGSMNNYVRFQVLDDTILSFTANSTDNRVGFLQYYTYKSILEGEIELEYYADLNSISENESLEYGGEYYLLFYRESEEGSKKGVINGTIQYALFDTYSLHRVSADTCSPGDCVLKDVEPSEAILIVNMGDVAHEAEFALPERYPNSWTTLLVCLGVIFGLLVVLPIICCIVCCVQSHRSKHHPKNKGVVLSTFGQTPQSQSVATPQSQTVVTPQAPPVYEPPQPQPAFEQPKPVTYEPQPAFEQPKPVTYEPQVFISLT